MKVTVRITKNFKTEAKPLLKKYPSFANDLLRLEKQLMANPHSGVSLGGNAYKIRLKIKSKGKGKSGGARVISLLETAAMIDIDPNDCNAIIVHLLSIYDKANVDSISDKELKDLIKQFYSDI